MTIQFRSRLTSVVDYTSELTTFGICCQYNKISNEYTHFKSTANQCYANQSSESTITKTFYPGAADDGTFTCTQSSTQRGCCCACKYAKESENYNDFINDENLLPIDSGDRCSVSSTADIPLYFDVGLKNNVEQCECEKIGGKWTPGDCPTETGNVENDNTTIRTYCHGSMTIKVPEEDDDKEPEDPLGTCCYNCASNEGGNPADCNCCQQGLPKTQCDSLQGFWLEPIDGEYADCSKCVTPSVYGICYNNTDGKCFSVWSNDIDPELTDADITPLLCQFEDQEGFSINVGSVDFIRNQISCNTYTTAIPELTRKYPKLFRRLECTDNCDCGTDCIEDDPSGINLDTCYMGILRANTSSVVSANVDIPSWQLLYTSDTSIANIGDGSDRNVGPWFCGACQSYSGQLVSDGKMVRPNGTPRTCGERGYYHLIEKNSDTYSLAVNYVPESTSGNYTCTDTIFNSGTSSAHGFGKCVRNGYEEVNDANRKAFFTYARNPNAPQSLEDVYTDQFGWAHGVCCNYNEKTCEITFQHNCTENSIFTTWKNLINRLKKTIPAFANIDNVDPDEQLTQVQDYFNQKKCLDSSSNPIACEACDAVCNFQGYACTVPCGESSCQCQSTTYDLYTAQTCPSNCTDCATQDGGSGCCKRWYGPEDGKCEGSSSYSSVSCVPPEPPEPLGICCDPNKNPPCLFNGTQVTRSQCEYNFYEDATTCNVCESNLIACCDHRYNTCTENVKPEQCGDYFYERPALDSNGNPVNDCSKCNFETIDLPECVNLNANVKVDKPSCTGTTQQKNTCLCSTGVCCKGNGTPEGSFGGQDQGSCFVVNDIQWLQNSYDNKYYPFSLTCGSGANKYDENYLTPFGRNELEVYDKCYDSANQGFKGSDIYSAAPDVLVSGDIIPYGVCCQYRDIDATTIEPNGCVLVKTTRNFCAGKLSEALAPGIKNRWIASYYECKDIWYYVSPGNPPGSGCSIKLTLPKYDCDICDKVVGDPNADPTSSAYHPEYLYPGTHFRIDSDGRVKHYYDYLPGTLPYTTEVKSCTTCNENFALDYLKQFYTFISGSRSKYYFNGLRADYIKARTTQAPCTLNPPDDTETIEEDCCSNFVPNPISGTYTEDYYTLSQEWNPKNLYTYDTCKCNPNYNVDDCYCKEASSCNLTDEDLQQYCGFVPNYGLCCSPNNRCAGILTAEQCAAEGPGYTWYDNTAYDNDADCPPEDPCQLGVCCQGPTCAENIKRFECQSPSTFRSYVDNPQGCSTNPCNIQTGRCCAYGTPDPLNTLAKAQTSCSVLTESACINSIGSNVTSLAGSNFNVSSVVWKQGEPCTDIRFTFQFNNTTGQLQSILEDVNPCLIGSCCTGDLQLGTESCLGVTAAHNCSVAQQQSGGLKFVSGNADCANGTQANPCNVSLCCSFDDNGVGSSSTTYKSCSDAGNDFYLACSSPLTPAVREESLCEFGVCCAAGGGTCYGLRRRVQCLYTCSDSGFANPSNIFVPIRDLGTEYDPGDPCKTVSLATNWCDIGICCVNGTCTSGTRGQCEALGGLDFRANTNCASNPNNCKLGYYCPNIGSDCSLPTCNPKSVNCLQDNKQGFFVPKNSIHESEWASYPFTENASTCSQACAPSLGSCCAPNSQTCDLNKTQAECPSGWNISNNCNNCKGACCNSDGNCTFVTKAQCDAISGIYKGNGVLCTSNPCSGSCCCLGIDSPCSTSTNIGTTTSAKNNCNTTCFNAGAGGGSYTNNKTCAEAPCTGACCTTGNCAQKTKTQCTSGNGQYLANGVQCTSQTCKGACCNNITANCTEVTQPNCASGSTFKGIGTSCDDDPPPCTASTGSCCKPDGTCTVTTFANCGGSPNVWTNQGSCIPNTCPQPKVPCCFASSNSCNTNLTSSQCSQQGGSPLAFGQTCDDCPGACCTGDEFGNCENNITKRTCAGYVPQCNPSSHYIGKNCTQVSCPPVKYPCCYDNGSQITCAQKTINECNNLGGRRSGECDESCNGNTCDGFGACCPSDGSACYAEYSNLCAADGGTPYPGQSCAQVNCDISTETSCCIKTIYSSDFCATDLNGNFYPIVVSNCVENLSESECLANIQARRFYAETDCYSIDDLADGVPSNEVPGDIFIEVQATFYNNSSSCNDECLGLSPITTPSCSYCCGCVDGRVRNCCYEKDIDGRFVCDEQINSVEYKGICQANTAHGKFCDSTQQIPVCAWIENNELNISNHRCTTLTDCEGTYNGTTNTTNVGSALILKSGESTECYVDKRLPRACCYIAYDAFNFPIGITCENVCTSLECETKSPVYSEVAIPSVDAPYLCLNIEDSYDNTNGGFCYQWCGCADGIKNELCFYKNESDIVDVYGLPPGVRACGSFTSPDILDEFKMLSPKEASYPSIFNSGAICGKELLDGKGSFNCGVESEGFLLKNSYRFSSNYLREENTGTCFTLVENSDGSYKYDCELSFKADCSSKGGYFVTLKDSNNNICTGSHAPTAPQFDSKDQLIAQTMTEEAFLEQGLSFGDYKWGGYFIGIFKPGETQVYGSDPQTLDRPIYRKSKVSSYGKSTGKGWALFVQDVSFKVRYFDYRTEQSLRASKNTSLHDGFNNLYKTELVQTGNLLNKLYFVNYGSFNDYYLPSLEEMQFLASKLHDDPSNYYIYLNKLHRQDINNSVFWTSSTFNTNLVYATYMDVENVKDFGKIVLVPAHARELYNAFFVRRIELT